jgi:hypothetical protein
VYYAFVEAAALRPGSRPVVIEHLKRQGLNHNGSSPALPGRQQKFDISRSRIHGPSMKL